MPMCAPEPTGVLADGDTLDLDGLAVHCLHTPGHSPGGISFHMPDAELVIAGDALFQGSVGRTDFPDSDPQALLSGIREKLYTLPDATTVLPGHGPATTIGQEKQTNPFVRG